MAPRTSCAPAVSLAPCGRCASRAFISVSRSCSCVPLPTSIAATCRRPRGARIARPVLLIHGVCLQSCRLATMIGVCALPASHPSGPSISSRCSPISTPTLLASRASCGPAAQCEGARVAIVAHSTGGLVARAALRCCRLERHQPDYYARLAAPWHRDRRACPVATDAADVPGTRPGCARSTRQRIPGVARIAVTSLYSAEDKLIVPRQQPRFSTGAESTLLPGLGHFALLARGSEHRPRAGSSACGGRV